MKEPLIVVHEIDGVRRTNRVAVKADTAKDAAAEIVGILADTYNVPATKVQIISTDLADKPPAKPVIPVKTDETQDTAKDAAAEVSTKPTGEGEQPAESDQSKGKKKS